MIFNRIKKKWDEYVVDEESDFLDQFITQPTIPEQQNTSSNPS